MFTALLIISLWFGGDNITAHFYAVPAEQCEEFAENERAYHANDFGVEEVITQCIYRGQGI